MTTARTIPFSHEGVPGKARLHIFVIPPGQPRPVVKLAGGEVRELPAFTLADVRTRRFQGKDEGYMTDIFAGRQYWVSLKPWANADPEKTLVVFEWRFHPKLPVAPEHRYLFNNFELTNDFYSAMTEDVTVEEVVAPSSPE